MKPQNPIRTVWLTLLTLALFATIGLMYLDIKHQSDQIETLKAQLTDERAAHNSDIQKANELLKKSVRF